MSIVNNDSNMLVSGTSGNDNITNYGSNVTINAESGNDTINNDAGTNVTINGGRGDDRVLNKDSYVMINGNDGKDYLWSGAPGSGILELEYVTLDGGAGNDYLTGSVENSLLIGGEGDDSIISSGRGGYNTIFAGDGNDTIQNHLPYSIIYGGAGNDYFHGGQGGYSTILCGEGDDKIIVNVDYDSKSSVTIHRLIDDGEGNDFIFLREVWAKNCSTIVCGKGDDTIDFDRCRYGDFVIQYTEGAGNDVIKADLWDGMPTINLSILKGNYTVTKDGNDLLVIVGEGSIRFINMAGTSKPIVINGIPATVTTSTSSTTPTTQTTTPTNTQTNTTPSTPATSTTTTPTTQTTTPTDTQTTTSTSTTTDGNGGGTTIIYNGPVTIINNTTINETNITNINNTYTYNGGDKIINNYQVGEIIVLASDYQGIDFNGDSFFVKSSSGAVEIQNSRDKFIGYSGSSSNNVVAYSYLASGGGNIDGRDKSQAEIMIGGDHANNQILAGNGGSSLWGGNGGTDTLTGGDGYDEFFFAIGSGNDVVKNAGDNDVINLLGVSLSQISSFSYDSSSVDLNFNNGEHLKVESTSSVGYRVENQTFYFNRATNEWANK